MARVESGVPKPVKVRPIKNHAREVEAWPIERLKPYANNPKDHPPGQVAQIVASVLEYGWTIPILVDEEGEIIAGHGRLLAAIELELTEVTVIVARGWTEAQKRAYRIADNRLTELGDWNEDALGIEFAALNDAGFALELTGFDPAATALLLGTPVDEIGTPPASSYREQYGVIVVCADADEQERVYAELKAAGHDCRVVVT